VAAAESVTVGVDCDDLQLDLDGERDAQGSSAAVAVRQVDL